MKKIIVDRNNNRYEVLIQRGDFRTEPVDFIGRKLTTNEIYRFWRFSDIKHYGQERLNLGVLNKEQLFFVLQDFKYR